jgi:hypothetical protein
MKMASRDFDQFLRRQQAEASAPSRFDWVRQRDEWLAHLDGLYKTVESLLSKYISSRQIRLEYRPIELNEDNIGSYTVQKMILKIGRQDVILKPIGTLLIGFKGRIDVEGPAGRRQIALVDSKALGVSDLIRVSVSIVGRSFPAKKKPTHSEKISQVEDALDGKETRWAWRIVSPPPERRFVELTQDSLFQLIMDVANA